VASVGVLRGLAVYAVTVLGVIFVVSDHGYTLDSHGGINLIALAGFTIVMAVIYLVLLVTACVLRGWRRALVLWGVAVVVLAGSRVAVLVDAHARWHDGILGQRMEPWGGCNVSAPGLSWEAIWPRSLLRVWTDTSCPRQGVRKGLAELSADGTFTMDCDEDGSVFVFPRLEWEHLAEDRLDFAHFPTTVLSRNTTLRYNGGNGETLDLGWATSVVARCGKKQEVLNNVVRNETAVRIAKENAARTSNKRELAPVSIMLMLLDTLSRNAMLRLLPESLDAMAALNGNPQSTHEVFQFFRYNSIAPFSKPNYEGLWTLTDTQQRDFSFFTQARELGAVSAFINDMCEWRADFTLNVGHPDLWPTLFCHPEYQPAHVDSYLLQGPYSPRRRCIGGRQVHTHAFELLRRFWGAYSDVQKLALWVAMEGHEMTTNVIAQLDGELAGVVSGKTVNTNNTVMFVFSDHGSHTSLSYFAKQPSAVIENRLPALFVLVPRWLLRQVPAIGEALRANEQALLTSRDLQATIAHLLSGRWPVSFANPIGQSLIHKPIAPRSCSDARIPKAMCACQPTVTV
jgi:hypothetical protein